MSPELFIFWQVLGSKFNLKIALILLWSNNLGLMGPQKTSAWTCFCINIILIGHVHIISYKVLFRFKKLHGMMWTHFPFNIYVEYEFKSFEHYFNVFWWKKEPLEKKKKERERERKYSNSNGKRMSKSIKNWFRLGSSHF